MAVSPILQSSSTSVAPSSPQKTVTQAQGQRFSDALAALAAQVGVTSNDVTRFFAQAPSAQVIASTASSLGLTKEQVTQFLDFAAYGGPDHASRAGAVDSFLQQHAQHYGTDAKGKIVSREEKASTATVHPEKALPATADIRSFFASNPTADQVTSKAKELGLDAAQFVEFQAIGNGLDVQRISAPVLETMYVESANRLGQDIGGGSNGGWTSYYAPNLGRAVTKDELTSFFATNPTQAQIFGKAAELGLSVSAVNNMMVGLEITKPQDYNKTYAAMDFALYQGTDGYSADSFGHIVEGGGHIERRNADGSRTWVPYSGLRPTGA